MSNQDNHVKYWWYLGSISAICFLIIAFSVNQQFIWVSHFDAVFQQFAHVIRTPQLTHFFTLLALFGTPTVNMLICFVITGWFWHHKYHFLASWALTAQVGIDTLTSFFKEVVQRPRPLDKLVAQGGFSFPSGHTSSTAVMVLIICLLVVPLIEGRFPRLIISSLAIVWLLLMGFDRIYLFVHYPSDVLGGLLLALAWWAVIRVSSKHVYPVKTQ
ncbi:phosphatase PAP2 family protein [Secundilactobacillus folii]|nr:phosphatase PAP2 family protein [Secundilactobacillus folii]